MPRLALLSLLLLLNACAGTGFAEFIDDTHSFADNPNLPAGDSINMRRVMALDSAVEPLQLEGGTIWPGPPEPIKTLRDLQMESNPGLPQEPSRQDGARQSQAAPRQQENEAPVTIANADGTATVLYPDGRVEFKTLTR